MSLSFRATGFVYPLLLPFLLSGCAAPTQKLAEEDRKKINLVRINSSVQRAPVMYYLGPGSGILIGLFGGIGGAVALASSAEPGKVLHDFAERNGVFIEKIALQEVTAALLESGKLKVADPEEATETIVNISVHHFGFTIPHGFSSKLVPSLAIKCEIVDATAKIIWSATDRVLALGNPVEAMSLEEMRDNPKRIEDAWRKASRHIAKNIVKEL